MRRLVAAMAVLLLALGAGPVARAEASAAATPARAGAAASSTTGFRWNDITATDGVILKSNVIAPTAPGRHPGVIFVASWGLNDFQYLAQAKKLAENGYVVLSYTARGFWFSGGKIEVAGPPDIADASTAVDWLIAHTAVDPERIGIAGLSYGGGISLLAAAHDKRLRAVAAMSGWADMAESMSGEETRRPQAAFFLEAVARLVGQPSDEMNRILADYWAGRNDDYREEWARGRSVRYSVGELNANHPAVLIAHAYGDSIFPVNQMVDLFDHLTTPRRLELAPGDHATVEVSGLLGLPNHVWTSLQRWLDHYLKGVDNGIDREPPVVLRPHGSGPAESYAGTGIGTVKRETLGRPGGWDKTGTLGRASDQAWSYQLTSGVGTTANGGIALVSNGLEQLTGVPPTVWLPSVNRRHAGVWVSDRQATAASIRGEVRVHLGIDPHRPDGTVVAYLYDLDAWGIGRLITHAPTSWHGAAGPFPVELSLPMTAYDVPAGHQLALVVDTKDPLYFDSNTRGAPLTFTGPSWMELPLR
ncbi:alpha/beta fold hydrolase [Actinoplanes sp. NPDC049316]|uniref:alpha/beta fold hydrolase n=1 Tax=Actinoplanes sp. NPDC049316 TaxID=3154727 RepID=UPI00343164F0